MKRLWLLALLLVAGLAWGQGTSWARRYQGGPAGGKTVEEGVDAADSSHWQRLTPAQRQELKQRYRQFKELPPAEQQELRQRYQRFRELSPEKKQRMLERHQRLQQLTPQQREQLRSEWQRLKELPPDKRRQQRRELRRQYFNGSNGQDRGHR